MKRLIMLVAAVLPLSALAPAAADAATRHPTVCSPLPVSAPPGAEVESVTATAHAAGTVTFPGIPPLPTPAPIADVPARCDITVTLTHPEADDHVTIQISLPQDRDDWTGRFQGTGGSAYLAGDFGAPLITAVKAGYVAAATDAGIGRSPVDVSGWALTADGEVNSPLLKNFASRSVHDMAVVGKDVALRFYGDPVRYAYWNGCSTGGRQGFAEAQDHPRDFQGVLATAPAINWDRFAVATLWPQVVFNEERTYPTPCELEAFNSAAVKACDTRDGVKDGVIADPQDCRWDPRRLIGAKVVCEGRTVTVSAAVADVVRKIWAGPVSPRGEKLWYGPAKGASFGYLAKVGEPFFVADSWVRYFVEQDPRFDTSKLTYRQFARVFQESQRAFNTVIGTDDPDLSAFRDAGGKLLSWHGQADELIPTQGSVDYRERVNWRMGGDQRVDDFYRLFLLPGVTHCGGGPGPQPADALGALVDWVEKGKAPATLATANADRTVIRDVCRYPRVTRRVGHGDPAAAAGYRCANG
ncbi:tannase/feruloyl esterase family alpha/beta hydrolase [Nonomuraea terrae]|uniref:tannase/feruloyl esterase family alpha/beta hydrolase n=1 Tax=Nonomuraea terrae TaxID=2530383 RepID=UPI00379368FE